MFSKRVVCPPTPSKISPKCVCDEPVKVRKTNEQILADKNLKELFKQDMRKDIFKLCADLENIAYDRRDSSSKKSHFLPPLYSVGDNYYEMREESATGEGDIIDDWSRFQMGLSDSIDMDYDPNIYTDKGEADYDPDSSKRRGDHDPNAHKRKNRYFGPKARKGKGEFGPDALKEDGKGKGELGPDALKGDGKGDGDEDYDGEGYGDSDDDKDGDKPKKKEIRFADSVHLSESKDFKEPIFDKDEDYGSPITFSFSDEDMDRLSLPKSIYDEIEEDFLNMVEEDTGEHLLKYYQLKRLAEKMKARADDIKATRVGGDDDYEDGYRLGFAKGHEKAYREEPLDYSNMAIEDQQLYALNGKSKIIYVATNPNNIDELKQAFLELDIEQSKRQELSSETDKLVAKKIEMYLKEFRETLLATKSPHFILGFVDGFYDAYHQTFIYNPSDETFENDEKFYASEVRKCLSYSDDVGYDYKVIMERSESLKALVHDINFEEYEEEMRRKTLKKSLHFTISDFLFFVNLKKSKKIDKEKEWKRKEMKKKKSPVKPPFSPKLPSTRRFPVLPEMPGLPKNLNLMFPPDKTRESLIERAGDYMNRHRIEDIFRYMGTMLCAYKPDDPIDFLINLLDKCLTFRISEIPEQAPLVFTPKHVESIYNEMDPFHFGYIDGMQYLYGLNLLEVTEEDDDNVDKEDRIEMNRFLLNANNRLLEKFRNMIAICGRKDRSYASTYQ